MKAAVLYQGEGIPRYVDIPEPVIQNEKEVLLTVTAAAVKHVDRSRAAGTHYSSSAPGTDGRVIGGDGIGLLPDGTRVYGLSVNGMLAERAVIEKDRMVRVPDGVDDITAAALPNAVIGAAMGLRFKADIRPGDIVLVNGATGFTGRVAVQLARHYGAKKVIATGRDPQSLHELLSLGADEIISLQQDDEGFKVQLSRLHAATPIDVVLDYLWGHPAEMILACIKGNGRFTNKIRYVSVGSMAGDLIQLSAANLRSVDLQLTGSGMGAWSRAQVGLLLTEILPEAFRLAAEGKLKVETIGMKLEDIGKLWEIEIPSGKRVVVTI